MKTYRKLIYGLMAMLLLTSAQCEKWNLDEDGLPRATQTGANNFGFLLNGEPWYPKGMAGLSPNLSMDINFTDSSNGRFGISGYRKSDTEEKTNFGIGLIKGLSTYSVPFSVPLNDENIRVYFFDGICEIFNTDADVTVSGELKVTKLDRTSGIISGTFEAVLQKEGCDIKITKGRFDMKF